MGPSHKNMIRHDVPRGFTLIEILVVVAIIGILLSLLLPSLSGSRETARMSQCSNNIRQLALGCLSHEAATKHFPAGGWGAHWIGMPNCDIGPDQPGGWIYQILPYIEQQALHDLGAGLTGADFITAQHQRATTPLPVLHCPTRRPPLAYPCSTKTSYIHECGLLTKAAMTDYAANGGSFFMMVVNGGPESVNDEKTYNWDDWIKTIDIPMLPFFNGIVAPHTWITTADITDGLSNTYLLGEKFVNIDSYDGWADRQSPAQNEMGNNFCAYGADGTDLHRWSAFQPTKDVNCKNTEPTFGFLPTQDSFWGTGSGNYGNLLGFGSAHNTGVNMAFCDGSVRVVHYNISLPIHARLSSRNDGREIGAETF